MTRDEALEIARKARDANNSVQNPFPTAGIEAEAAVIQQAFTKRDGEIERLRNWQSVAFEVEPNIDIDIERIFAAKGDSRG